MGDSRYAGPITTAHLWGLIVALGIAPSFFIPVQFAVLQFLPFQAEVILFLAAVVITIALAAALGFAMRLFGDWILARTSPEVRPWLWAIPILLSGLSLAYALDIV